MLPLANAEVVSNSRFPVAITVSIPCANGGAGDVVVVSGQLHDIFSVTVNDNTFHLRFHDNPQGITGVGQDTGTTYHATGITREDFNVNGVDFPFNSTFVNNFRIIGDGPGNNFLVHDNFHVTNADGTVVAYHDNFSIECK